MNLQILGLQHYIKEALVQMSSWEFWKNINDSFLYNT